MVDLLTIYNRAQKGNKMTAESFDLDCVYAILSRLLQKYDIKYDPDTPVPSDDALADKVFDAAVDFFCDCGVYIGLNYAGLSDWGRKCYTSVISCSAL